MNDRLQELREAIERSRSGKSRWRCPSSLRSEIASYVGLVRESGVSWSKIAESLSVSEGSLSRWCRGESGGFREIRMKREELHIATICAWRWRYV